MAKGKSSSGSGIATAAIYVFLVAVLGTYFLPIVGVNLPAFGRTSSQYQQMERIVGMGLGHQPKGWRVPFGADSKHHRASPPSRYASTIGVCPNRTAENPLPPLHEEKRGV